MHPSLRALRSSRRSDIDVTTSDDARPSASELKWPDYYVLIPGTPATCTQLGLFHHDVLFPDFTAGTGTSNSDVSHSPIDLVLSGPNYGRNTTAAFALSSGTIGGAMEGAICGVRVCCPLYYSWKQLLICCLNTGNRIIFRLLHAR